jgi:predicted amidophosphoribosyltransferase
MKGLAGGLFALDVQQCAEHACLSAADRCHCLSEYLPGRGYRAGEVNQLIVNLKCAPSIAALDSRRRHYKLRAINDIATALRTAVDRATVECTTWIPIPTSRPAGDADYDDRLLRILRAAFGHYQLDLRSALYQRHAMPPDHSSVRRLRAEALSLVIGLDRELLLREPLRERIVLFDDVLTSGKHYKCCERRLRELLADVPISGLFVARRVLPRRRGCPPPPAHAGTARALIAP